MNNKIIVFFILASSITGIGLAQTASTGPGTSTAGRSSSTMGNNGISGGNGNLRAGSLGNESNMDENTGGMNNENNELNENNENNMNNENGQNNLDNGTSTITNTNGNAL